MSESPREPTREEFERYLAATEPLLRHPPRELRGKSREDVHAAVRAACTAAGLDHVPEDKIRASANIVLRQLYGSWSSVEKNVGPDPFADPVPRIEPLSAEQQAARKTAFEAVRVNRAGKSRDQLSAELDIELANRGLPPLTPAGRAMVIEMLDGDPKASRTLDGLGMTARLARLGFGKAKTLADELNKNQVRDSGPPRHRRR